MKLLKPAVNLMHDDETENKLDRAWAVLTDEAKQRISPAHEKLLQIS